jgi:peptide/nickel transport system substrate-binding protein
MAKIARVGILAPVRTLDPRQSRETVSTTAASQIYETPCKPPKGDGPAEPLLLDTPVAENAQTWTATVRPGIAFSDGTPLTPALAAEALSRAEPVKQQAKVETRGDRVVFQLAAPNPRFDLTLTLHQCSLILEKAGRILGTGPYMPGPGSSLADVKLVKNPQYRAPVAIDEIVFKVYPADKDGRPTALLDAIARGEVDFTNMLSRTDATAVAAMRKAFQPANSTAILFFNCERPALSRPETRRALALAIDRMAIAAISYQNALAFVATGLLPPLMGAFRDEIAYAPERAQAELQKAGPPPPLVLATVWAPRPYLPNPQPVAELLAKQLSAVGVETRLMTPPTNDDFYKMCIRGDYDLLLAGWIGDTSDPADFLEAVLRSDRVQAQAMAGVPLANRSRFRNPAMDAALKAFREDRSAERRAAVLKLIVDEMPLLPLMYGPTVALSSWKLTNLEITPLGIPVFGGADLNG